MAQFRNFKKHEIRKFQQCATSVYTKNIINLKYIYLNIIYKIYCRKYFGFISLRSSGKFTGCVIVIMERDASKYIKCLYMY